MIGERGGAQWRITIFKAAVAQMDRAVAPDGES